MSLKVNVVVETNEPTDDLAPLSLHIGKTIGSSATTVTQASTDEKWITYINNGLNAANEHAVSNAQKVCTMQALYCIGGCSEQLSVFKHRFSTLTGKTLMVYWPLLRTVYLYTLYHCDQNDCVSLVANNVIM